jgi:6-phosphogluconolactonase (cycloisomerase 2 family)
MRKILHVAATSVIGLALINNLGCGGTALRTPADALPTAAAPSVPSGAQYVYSYGYQIPHVDGDGRNIVKVVRLAPAPVAGVPGSTYIENCGSTANCTIDTQGIVAFGDLVFISSSNSDSPQQAKLSTLHVNPATGALSEVWSAAVAAGQLALDPAGQYLYGVTDHDIAAFQINRTTGALTALAGSPYYTVRGAAHPVISPDGAWLCGAGFFKPGRIVQCYRRDPVSGTIFAGEGNEITDYRTGVVDQIKFAPNGILVASFAAEPDAVNSFAAPTLVTYRTNLTGLQMIEAMPISIGNDPDVADVSPDGRSLVITAENTAALFALDAATGNLSLKSQMSVSQPSRAVFSKDSHSVAVCLTFPDYAVGVYTVSDGTLAAVGGSPFPVQVECIAPALATP